MNRRLIRDRVLLHAITEAYRNIIPPACFPVVLLFVELPYQEVDVNVHPSKIEVRFRQPKLVHDFTRDAMRNALSKVRPMAGFLAGAAGAAQPFATAPATSPRPERRRRGSRRGKATPRPTRRGMRSGERRRRPRAVGVGVVAGPPHAVIPTSFSPGAALEEEI